MDIPFSSTPAASPYATCALCPRSCRVDRTGDGPVFGFCGESARIRAACACLHFGEEPPITGKGGSGTVFFTGCTLKCDFCQNWQTSRCGFGDELTEEGLAEIFLRLQEAGAENINIVTGTHFAPGILDALCCARKAGLTIPMVWNSSGYELPAVVELLSGHVSFFLPDLKTLDPSLSRSHCGAPDYPDRCREALLAMARAKPLAWEGDEPTGGVIVRHLVLPGCLPQTREVLEWFKGNLDGKALLSLMFQYTPIPGRVLPAPFDRMTTIQEYEQALALLEELDLEEGFFQEPIPDGSWLPDFRREKPFSSDLSRMVWHCGAGPRGEAARR